jgi:hypothetical protein
VTEAHDPKPLPLWVRAVDAAVVVLGLVAFSVLAFGGFRVWIGEVRLSVTDWIRPALWALALGIVRAVAARQQPLPWRVWRAVGAWWRADDTRRILPVFLATRLGVLAVGFLAVVLIGFPSGDSLEFQIYRNALLDLPSRWDTGWYLTIANEGYQWSPGSNTRQQNITFFPAFPMIVRYLSIVLGRQPVWTGVLVSFVAFFWACGYLLRLGRDLLGDTDRAAAAVLLLASYPFALFYSAAYTESLFLLASVGAIYHFRRNEMVRAAVWGLITGLTRPNGAFLSAVLGLMLVEPAWRAWQARRRGAAPVAWATHFDALAAAASPGIGMLIYSTFILYLTGNPFQWIAQQEAWGREYRGVETLLTDRVEYVAQNGLYSYASSQALDMIYFLSILFILASAWPVARRFGLPYAVWLLVSVLPPVAAGGLLSMGRLTAVLFPAFFWLAAIIPPPHRIAWASVFALLQGFAAVMFFTWRPLY